VREAARGSTSPTRSAGTPAGARGDPEAGDVIPGSGGVRKLRWRIAALGKRGGHAKADLDVDLVRENVAENVPPTLRRSGTKSMAKPTRNVGLEILEGLRQLKRSDHGRIINVPPVTSVREKTGLSQSRFAELLGVSVRTLQEWEQGRRAPSGAARTLLLIAAKNPRALLDVA
jgi:putative transcriptional regulator